MQSSFSAYPFLFEDSQLCDFEIMTDLYASKIGTVYAKAEKEDKDTIRFLCELVYHANPCLRNPCMITDEDIDKLLKIQNDMNYLVPKAFILPLSENEVSGLFHQLRSEAKSIVRLIYKISETEKITVHQNIVDLFNILSQIFFEFALKYAEDAAVFKSRTY